MLTTVLLHAHMYNCRHDICRWSWFAANTSATRVGRRFCRMKTRHRTYWSDCCGCASCQKTRSDMNWKVAALWSASCMSMAALCPWVHETRPSFSIRLKLFITHFGLLRIVTSQVMKFLIKLIEICWKQITVFQVYWFSIPQFSNRDSNWIC